jgi:hypothetical protein
VGLQLAMGKFIENPVFLFPDKKLLDLWSMARYSNSLSFKSRREYSETELQFIK